MSIKSQGSVERNSQTPSPAQKEFDRIIDEATVESDALDHAVKDLSESAKAFAKRHEVNKNG